MLDDLAEKRRGILLWKGVMETSFSVRRRDEQALQAKREAARLRRREQDQERRVDPDDNKGYTWEELRERYRGMFSEQELADYWQTEPQGVLSTLGAIESAFPGV